MDDPAATCLLVTRSASEAQVVVALLQAAGIPARVAGPGTWLEHPWPTVGRPPREACVAVPAACYQAACDLLAEARNAADPPPDEPAP